MLIYGDFMRFLFLGVFRAISSLRLAFRSLSALEVMLLDYI